MMPEDYNLGDSTCEQDSLNLIGLTDECRYLGLSYYYSNNGWDDCFKMICL